MGLRHIYDGVLIESVFFRTFMNCFRLKICHCNSVFFFDFALIGGKLGFDCSKQILVAEAVVLKRPTAQDKSLG